MLPSVILLLASYAAALPIPANDDAVTEIVVAPTQTVVENVPTGTTTTWLPPVQVLISNGVAYTYTPPVGDAAATGQQKNVVNNNVPLSTVAPVVTEVVGTRYTTISTSATPPNFIASSTLVQSTPTSSVLNNNNNNVPSSSGSYGTTQSNSLPKTPGQGNNMGSSSVIPQSSSAYQSFQNSSPSSASLASSSSSTVASTTPTSTSNTPNTLSTLSTLSAPITYSSSSTSVTSSTSSTISSSSTLASSASGLLSPPQTIVYSPFNNDRSCKTYDTIKGDLQMILAKNIKKVRLYGVDCLTISAILPLCKELGISVNQGFWITEAGVNSIDSSVSGIIQWAQTNGWGVFDYFTIGNEAVLSGFATAGDLISKISQVKSQLQGAGYSGKVTTAEPPAIYFQHPELCTQSAIDFVGINSHSYFNTNLFANQAGQYVTMQQKQVADLCSMRVEITETGYPHAGIVNGNNVPSPANQKIALETILSATGGDVTILTTFDDFWKDPGPFGIEQSFGMINLVS